MKTYAVKSIFPTLQGEGAHAGRPAVFVRLAGCNLWSGREADRGNGPGSCSAWCDTDFLGGERLAAAEVARRCADLWPGRAHRFAVLTGGEPALQVDHLLVDSLHRFGFEVAIETNGTRELPGNLDWVTVSPKAGTEIVRRRGGELKLVWPQEGLDPAEFLGWSFERFYLQPMDGPDREANTKLCLDYCRANPAWRLSVQVHKWLGIE